MGRADHRRAGLPGQAGEQDRDRDRVRSVEAGGRLVGEQQPRPHDERAGDRDPGPLALREPRDTLGRPLAEADRLERRERRCRAAVEAAQREHELDVLERRQMRHEPRLLPDVGDLLAAQRRTGGAVERRQLHALDRDRAGVGEREPGEHVQQRRLAGPRRPGDGVQPPAVELEADAVEHRRLAVAAHQPAGRARQSVRRAPES